MLLQLSSLPSRISYSTVELVSGDVKLRIPRRELFDSRLQLMAEDVGQGSESVIGLDQNDIKTNIYEGGFKTWECSIDLAQLLLNRDDPRGFGDISQVDHIVEVGVGNSSLRLIVFYCFAHLTTTTFRIWVLLRVPQTLTIFYCV